MRFRLAEPADLDFIEGSYTRVLTREKQTGVTTTNWEAGVYPTRRHAEAGLEEGTLWILEDEGHPVSSLILNHWQPEGYGEVPWAYAAEPQETIVIHTLVVDPVYAGKGCGKASVIAACDAAKAQGAKVMRLDTWEQNAPAAAMYRGLGFRYAGSVHTRHMGLIDEILIYFEKQL